MTLFTDALVIDGTGIAPFKADVLVDGPSIKAVGQGLKERYPNADAIDVDGRILCPGFMDIHAHSELEALRSPSMPHKVQQGITFDLSGNCGIGVYPRRLDDPTVFADILGHYDRPWSWTDFQSFAEHLEPGINMGFLQSHSMLRYAAMEGNPNRPATETEVSRMCELLDVSMQQGCFGLSSGLYYAPCLFADGHEMERLLSVVERHSGIFTVHHRCEGDEVLQSIDEVIGYARKTGVSLEISHLKAIGRKNQDKVDAMLGRIHAFKDEGFDVHFDQYPYEYGSTSLFSLLPPFLLRLEKDELSKTLASIEDDISLRRRTIDEMTTPKGWDSIVELCGWDSIRIVSLESSPEYDGLTLSEASRKLGRDPFDTLFHLLSRERELALMTDVTQSAESLRKIFKDPLMLFGTDALYTGGLAHPRSANAAIHLIENMCIKDGAATFEENISKMTYKVAQRLGIKDRGVVKEGMKADIVVFDPETLHDESTPDNPFARCRGLDYVMVNGRFAIYEAAPTESRSGSVIRDN